MEGYSFGAVRMPNLHGATSAAPPPGRKCWAERMPFPAEAATLARVHEHWDRLRAGAAMPPREAIRPEDLHFVLGYVNLIEIRQDPEQFVLRLVGTKIFDRRPDSDQIITAADLTPRAYSELVSGHYREARDLAAPTLYRIFVTNFVDTRHYMRIILPLAWEGRAPGMLLTASYFEEPIKQVTRTDRFLRDD
jgi:hypothetical protein